MNKNQKSKIKNQKLLIEASGEQGIVSYQGNVWKVMLKQQPIVAGIERVVADLGALKGIEVKIENATFSTTRQVVTAVNTLAWVLGIKVNGENQLSPKYSGKPNITKQSHVA